MKRTIFLGCLAALCLWVSMGAASGKDIVINDGFELKGKDLDVYWTVDGFDESLYPSCWAVQYFDTNGDGQASGSFRTDPFTHSLFGISEGYLKQHIFVEAGKTYVVSADICYANC